MAINDIAGGRKTIASKTRDAFLSDVDVQVFDVAGADTWIKPDGAQYVLVELVGGGGGGGGVTQNASGVGTGGGGGAGGFCRKFYSASDLDATEAINVGSAGTGAANGTGSGVSGGNTTFKGLTGGGGAGGSGSTATTGDTSSAGGAGGTATGGDVNVSGSSGDLGRSLAGANIFQGRGAASMFGPQTAPSVAVGGAGPSASGYGAGGSGAYASTVTRAGGAGTSGICIVTTYL